MSDAIIGCSGFVGSTLLRQRSFAGHFRSTNVHEVGHNAYDLVVCAAAPAQKWLANKHPEDDRKKIDALCESLKKVRCHTFVLISTVDVFAVPQKVDEDSPIEEAGLHPYGLHRRMLEAFVEKTFARFLIVRLPGLVGPGLRKNILFDLQNDNQVDAIDGRAVYQFYPMVNLVYDLQAALDAQLSLLHLTAAPLLTSEVARTCFGRALAAPPARPAVAYDLHTRHAEIFGGSGAYTYDERASLQAIRAYAQSEPRSDAPRAA